MNETDINFKELEQTFLEAFKSSCSLYFYKLIKFSMITVFLAFMFNLGLDLSYQFIVFIHFTLTIIYCFYLTLSLPNLCSKKYGVISKINSDDPYIKQSLHNYIENEHSIIDQAKYNLSCWLITSFLLLLLFPQIYSNALNDNCFDADCVIKYIDDHQEQTLIQK